MELRPGRAGALVDSPDGVLLTDVPPGARVTIEARLELGGQSWQCSGVYVADRDGEVDTALDASSGGSYRGVDPFGLFWSTDLARPYDWDALRPMRVTLRAHCDDQTVDASYSRALLGPGVTEHDISQPVAVGRLFLPGPDSGPPVVLLGGSDGGPGLPAWGALLASHGLAALSLAYWRHPGVSDVLRDIDVEYVVRACDWLRAQDGVEDRAPALVGASRGGELALLAASLMPAGIGPVASLVGSGVAWGAWGAGTHVSETAWRFQGRPVPQLDEDEDDPDACIEDAEMVAAAEIPVEQATGPVLLLAGEDDQMWPSARLSRIAEARAERREAGERVTMVGYPDAGHQATVPPGFPLASSLVHPVNGTEYPFGGSRAGNQGARLDAWRRLLDHVEAPHPWTAR